MLTNKEDLQQSKKCLDGTDNIISITKRKQIIGGGELFFKSSVIYKLGPNGATRIKKDTEGDNLSHIRNMDEIS